MRLRIVESGQRRNNYSFNYNSITNLFIILVVLKILSTFAPQFSNTMKKQYIKPIIVLEGIESQDYITTSNYNGCNCWAHQGNHYKCSPGCHNNSKAKESNFFIYNECYE